MTTVRLAPLILLAVFLFACGSAAPGSAPAAPAADVEEITFEISALM